MVRHTIDRPEGLLLWVHSEAMEDTGPGSVLARELSELVERNVHVLLTVNDQITAQSEDGVSQMPAPADTTAEIEHFLDHWHPSSGLVIGVPANPSLLKDAAHRFPMFQAVAARNEGGAPLRYPAYLQDFHTCLASSTAEASAIRQVVRGSKVKVETLGPLSDTVHVLPCNQAECDTLAELLGGRPVWLAARVSPGEAATVEKAHRKAFRSAHRLLLILVPDLPEDGAKISEALESSGWQVGLRSRGDEPDPDVQIYVADTTEELGLWYRLAPATFAGGTLEPGRRPTDPFHPAALGSAVLHGPHIDRNPARFRRLEAQNATLPVKDADELGEAVIALLSPDKAAALAQAGWATTTESAHVVERLAELMHAEFETTEGVP